jgi:hypothetical protein
MKRIQSESRQPGMQSVRQWDNRPELSRYARAAGELRRAETEEIRKAELQLENLALLIRKVNRRIK